MTGIRKNRISTSRLTLSALLVAVMLVLGRLEALLPSVGVPGIKLGLSNSILIFAVYMLGIPTSFILMTLKVVLSGLMFGGVQAMVYAFSGGLLSLIAMSVLSRFKKLSPVVVSMAGGLFHNVGQFAIARFLTGGLPYIYLGALCIAGLVCGFLTGTAAKAVMRHSSITRMVKPEEKEKKRSWILPALAAILLAAGVAFAVHAYIKSRPVAVEPVDDGVPKILSPEEMGQQLTGTGSVTLPKGE